MGPAIFVVCFRSANVRCGQSFSRTNGANVQQFKYVLCVRCTERTPWIDAWHVARIGQTRK